MFHLWRPDVNVQLRFLTMEGLKGLGSRPAAPTPTSSTRWMPSENLPVGVSPNISKYGMVYHWNNLMFINLYQFSHLITLILGFSQHASRILDEQETGLQHHRDVPSGRSSFIASNGITRHQQCGIKLDASGPAFETVKLM